MVYLSIQHKDSRYCLQEMIRQFGKRLGYIRRQSECQENSNNHSDDFRNRSQSLDSQTIIKHQSSTLDSDCETTYRIYESILRQGHTQTLIGLG
ncbi:hypothetical protein TSAR_000677 [Trichomalopsis sarcophagae]|uniref:Uncharacterized protein n=1 Tax=Trichomalopsis sarcophagae TaxID=543379 RepID=A0A232EUU4_9HYME|nr:hypothetical protein TSAR_000677 [Trichomalopsis sarcophagae]